MEERQEGKDIYAEGVKTIVGYHKRSLLDFIDALERQCQNQTEKDRLGFMKGRVHNELSQCVFSLGSLLASMRSGGNIEPFKDNLIYSKPDNKGQQRYPIRPNNQQTDKK